MKYIVAVSGGVDSVVLLHMLENRALPDFSEQAQFIVAHFDHGIREGSGDDAVFVRELAKEYDYSFELYRANLGKNCSEEQARQERYDFLRQCSKKYNASGIVLAHHRDDVVETVILNLIRGTGWRGLSSLRSNAELRRPLLSFSKQQLIDYAKQHHLTWVEDATNTDEKYLRNYIRHRLIPKAESRDTNFITHILTCISKSTTQREEIDGMLDKITASFVNGEGYNIRRYEFVMMPTSVVKEITYFVLLKLNPDWHPSSMQITRALHFGKTARVGTQLQVGDGLILESKKHTLEFKKY